MTELFMTTLGDEGVEALAEAIHNASELTLLDLQGNKIGPRGAAALALVLPSLPQLHTLWLPSNLFGNEGVLSIALVLPRLPKLMDFDISFNHFGIEGSKALAKSIVAVESARGGVYFDDIEGVDLAALAYARAMALPKADTKPADAPAKAQCESPPCADDLSSGSFFVNALRQECSSLLAVAGSGRFLQGALESLGVEDLSALQVLDSSEIDAGLREARVPAAPRKQLSRCLHLALARGGAAETKSEKQVEL